MKKIGRHKPLSLVNALTVSRELVNDGSMADAIRTYLSVPEVARWLVRGPLVMSQVRYIETPEDFMSLTTTAYVRGVWDAVYIGRRKRR